MDPAGRQIALAYDTAQRLAHLIPENGQPYDFTYDAADRLIEEKRPDGTRLGYEYDAASQLVAITHHLGIGDDILTEIEPATAGTPAIAVVSGPRRTALIRDAAGQLIEKRCGTQVSRYRYDPAGRLIEAQRLELPASDAQGAVPPRLTFADKVVEPRLLHSVRLSYDAQGQIVTETSTDHVRGESHTLRHDHDALGNRVRTDLPDLPGRAARSLDGVH
jgi:YD repeat-containing protein